MMAGSEVDLKKCLELLLERFSREGAIQWLLIAHPLLGNKQPLQVLADGRPQAVISVLQRLGPKSVS